MWAKPAARGRCAWRRRDAATGRQCSRCCHQSNSSSSTLFSHCALATADRNQADEFADVPSGAAVDPSAVGHPGSWTEPPCPHFLGTATRPERRRPRATRLLSPGERAVRTGDLRFQAGHVPDELRF